MSVTTFMRQCLDAGMPVDMAMQAAEAFERNADAEREKLMASLLDRLSVDAKAEKRRAKDRQRKRDAKGTEHGIPRNSADSTEIVEIKKVPEPLKNNTPSPPLKGGISPVSAVSQPEKPETTEPQKSIKAWSSEIWQQTPLKARQRSGQQLAENALKAAVRGGAQPAAVKSGLEAYYASPDATKDGGEYAKGLHRAIQNGLWQVFAPEPPSGPRPPDDPWPQRLTRWRTAGYWNSEWGPKPGKPGYRGPDIEGLAA